MMMAMKAFVVVMTTTNMENTDHNDAAADDADDNGDDADSGAAGSGGGGLRLALLPAHSQTFILCYHYLFQYNTCSSTSNISISKQTTQQETTCPNQQRTWGHSHLQYFSLSNKQLGCLDNGSIWHISVLQSASCRGFKRTADVSKRLTKRRALSNPLLWICIFPKGGSWVERFSFH